jgi:hypothetical protein
LFADDAVDIAWDDSSKDYTDLPPAIAAAAAAEKAKEEHRQRQQEERRAAAAKLEVRVAQVCVRVGKFIITPLWRWGECIGRDPSLGMVACGWWIQLHLNSTLLDMWRLHREGGWEGAAARTCMVGLKDREAG